MLIKLYFKVCIQNSVTKIKEKQILRKKMAQKKKPALQVRLAETYYTFFFFNLLLLTVEYDSLFTKLKL